MTTCLVALAGQRVSNIHLRQQLSGPDLYFSCFHRPKSGSGVNSYILRACFKAKVQAEVYDCWNLNVLLLCMFGQVAVALDGRTYIGAAGAVALGNTAPGISNSQSADTVMFVALPSVVSTYPTNGLFDAQTEITVKCNKAWPFPFATMHFQIFVTPDNVAELQIRGIDFCNETASLSCNNSIAAAAASLDSSAGNGEFCIFDFISVLPSTDQWQVRRAVS